METKKAALNHLKKWEEKKGKPFQTWKQVTVVASYIDFLNEQTTSQQQTIERLREGLKLAKNYIDKSPFDPDVYPQQLEAWNKYQEFLKNVGEQLLNTTEPINPLDDEDDPTTRNLNNG